MFKTRVIIAKGLFHSIMLTNMNIMHVMIALIKKEKSNEKSTNWFVSTLTANNSKNNRKYVEVGQLTLSHLLPITAARMASAT